MSGDQTDQDQKALYTFQEKDLYGATKSTEKTKEEQEEEEKKHKTYGFRGAGCGLNEVCHYFGKRPPFAQGCIEFLEDTFVMMDPFAPREKGRPNFLTIGGKCRYCENEVCVECSIFYAKRMCRDCANLHFDELPNEIQAKLKAKK